MKIRHLPYAVAAGPYNMAADEALLSTAGDGQASLRFYGWSEATLSLGYFQHCDVRLADLLLASLPWVRRPTGGATLVHHYELTYALAVPLTAESKPRSWMGDMHRIIARALAECGFRPAAVGQAFQPARVSGGLESLPHSPLCFQQPTPGDLLHGQHKVLGSSQRKHHRALLQHGALLLAQSPFTPMLPGIRELTGVELTVGPLIEAILRAFQDATGWTVAESTWQPAEQEEIQRLIAQKYAAAAWNERR